MAHIRSLGLQNFRVFSERTDFQFSPITVLTGTNSSGKSTVINALSLLKKYLGNKKIQNFSDLGDLDIFKIGAKLGDFSKLINNDSGRETITFSIATLFQGIVDKIELRLSLSLKDNQIRSGVLTGIEYFSTEKDKVICSFIRQEKEWIISLDYEYFFIEFKRESEQIQLFNKLQKEKQGYYKRLNQLLENESESPLIKKIENAIDKLEKKQLLLHPEYFRNLNMPFDLDFEHGDIVSKTISYIPYFEEYNVVENKQFYEPKGTLFEYEVYSKPNDYPDAKPDEKFAQLTGLSENKEETTGKLSSEEDEIAFLKEFKFVIPIISRYDAIDYALDYISNPAERIESAVKYNEYKIAFTDNQKGTFLYNFLLNQNNSINSLDYDSFNDAKRDSKSKGSAFFKDFISDNLLFSLNHAKEGFDSCSFLSSIRAIVSRSYNVHKDESDLNSLIVDFLGHDTDNNVLVFINKYLKIFEIGEGIIIDKDEEGNNNKIYIEKDNRKILLADLGYGISQVLPIILKISLLAINSFYDPHESMNLKVLCIEEPETNLHPALQSKLADLLVDAYKRFYIQFIVETHSEYFIRKLQYHTVRGEIDPSFSTIYYFYHPDSVPPFELQVKRICISEDGSLSDDFGSGFFDEADKIAISIWNMNKSQKN